MTIDVRSDAVLIDELQECIGVWSRGNRDRVALMASLVTAGLANVVPLPLLEGFAAREWRPIEKWLVLELRTHLGFDEFAPPSWVDCMTS